MKWTATKTILPSFKQQWNLPANHAMWAVTLSSLLCHTDDYIPLRTDFFRLPVPPLTHMNPELCLDSQSVQRLHRQHVSCCVMKMSHIWEACTVLHRDTMNWMTFDPQVWLTLTHLLSHRCSYAALVCVMCRWIRWLDTCHQKAPLFQFCLVSENCSTWIQKLKKQF